MEPTGTEAFKIYKAHLAYNDGAGTTEASNARVAVFAMTLVENANVSKATLSGLQHPKCASSIKAVINNSSCTGPAGICVYEFIQ